MRCLESPEVKGFKGGMIKGGLIIAISGSRNPDLTEEPSTSYSLQILQKQDIHTNHDIPTPVGRPTAPFLPKPVVLDLPGSLDSFENLIRAQILSPKN